MAQKPKYKPRASHAKLKQPESINISRDEILAQARRNALSKSVQNRPTLKESLRLAVMHLENSIESYCDNPDVDTVRHATETMLAVNLIKQHIESLDQPATMAAKLKELGVAA